MIKQILSISLITLSIAATPTPIPEKGSSEYKEIEAARDALQVRIETFEHSAIASLRR